MNENTYNSSTTLPLQQIVKALQFYMRHHAPDSFLLKRNVAIDHTNIEIVEDKDGNRCLKIPYNIPSV
jgi:hypothetical protein